MFTDEKISGWIKERLLNTVESLEMGNYTIHGNPPINLSHALECMGRWMVCGEVQSGTEGRVPSQQAGSKRKEKLMWSGLPKALLRPQGWGARAERIFASLERTGKSHHEDQE